MLAMLDGESGKFQIALPGMFFEMNSSDGSMTLTNGKASILMQGETIALDGVLILGGTKPNPAAKFLVSAMASPVPVPTATGPGVTATLASAAKGVFPAV
jgi:hypothetical protein